MDTSSRLSSVEVDDSSPTGGCLWHPRPKFRAKLGLGAQANRTLCLSNGEILRLIAIGVSGW